MLRDGLTHTRNKKTIHCFRRQDSFKEIIDRYVIPIRKKYDTAYRKPQVHRRLTTKRIETHTTK